MFYAAMTTDSCWLVALDQQLGKVLGSQIVYEEEPDHLTLLTKSLPRAELITDRIGKFPISVSVRHVTVCLSTELDKPAHRKPLKKWAVVLRQS